MSFKAQIIESVKWMAVGRILGQMVSWGATIWVIRILTPEDYGLVSMVMIVSGLGEVFKEMGIGSSLVHKGDLTIHHSKKAFGALLILNSIIYLMLWTLSYPASLYFNEERLVFLIRVAALQFPLAALITVPYSLLAREMNFRAKSWIIFFKITLASLFTLGFAVYGMGVWSIILGNLAGSIIEAFLSIYHSKFYRLPIFSFKGLLADFKFGGLVTLSRLAWVYYTKIDAILIGKVLGKQALGVYSVALDLATMPMQKVSGILNEIAFAGFCKNKNNVAKVADHFCHASRIIAVFAFPIFWGISLTSHQIVYLFLGEKWNDVIIPLQYISIAVPFFMLSNVSMPVLMALNKVKIGLQNSLIASLVITVAFVSGVNFGVPGVAFAWLSSYFVISIVSIFRSLKCLNLNFYHYFKYINKPIFASFLMYTLSLFLSHFTFQTSDSQMFQLFILVLIGSLTYIVSTYLIAKDLFADVLNIIGISKA